jgi:hypothetical protein
VHFSDTRAGVDPVALQVEVTTHLSALGVLDVSVTAIQAGIEDAFMELMGTPAEAAA